MTNIIYLEKALECLGKVKPYQLEIDDKDVVIDAYIDLNIVVEKLIKKKGTEHVD